MCSWSAPLFSHMQKSGFLMMRLKSMCVFLTVNYVRKMLIFWHHYVIVYSFCNLYDRGYRIFLPWSQGTWRNPRKGFPYLFCKIFWVLSKHQISSHITFQEHISLNRDNSGSIRILWDKIAHVPGWREIMKFSVQIFSKTIYAIFFFIKFFLTKIQWDFDQKKKK